MGNSIFNTSKLELKENKNRLNADREIEIKNLIEYVDSDGVGNDYIFGPISEESVKNLAEGIRESGFKTAVEVWELDGENKGKYMIYSGHRRVAAVKELGETKVKCDVYPYPDDELDRRLQFLRANIHSRGSIKASEEGGDIYIAHQIKYLEDILRKKGVKGNINQRICEEFNAKRNTVWKYKSLLRACDELLKAEAEGHIRLEQAAAICSYNKDDQKIIVKVIEESISKGEVLKSKDLDKLIKKLHEKEMDTEMDSTLLQEQVSMIIASILEKKDEIETPSVLDNEKKDNKSVTVYDKYMSRASQLKKDLINNRFDNLKPVEVESILKEYDEVRKELEKAKLFSELMSGMYHGVPVVNSTEIDPEDLKLFNALQLRKLTKAYDKAENLDNIVNQISTIEAEIIMTTKKI